MKRQSLFATGALLALLSPVAVLAQAAPGGPGQGGPSPEMRAQMQQAREQAETSALNDLSADHRAKVQAIVAQVQSGSLDWRDGASQIDGVLSPAEKQSVLGEAQKMHDAMQKAFGGTMPGHGGSMNRQPDAGMFLIMVSRQHRHPGV